MYNFGFATATGICLITKCTATVRSELYNRVLKLFQSALMNNRSSILTNSSYSETVTSLQSFKKAV